MIKRLAFSAVDKTLEHDWTIFDSTKCPRRDGQVVAYEIEFGDSRLRKIQLVGIGYADFTPFNGEHFAGGLFCH